MVDTTSPFRDMRPPPLAKESGIGTLEVCDMTVEICGSSNRSGRVEWRNGPAKVVSDASSLPRSRVLLLRQARGHLRPHPAPVPASQEAPERCSGDDDPGMLDL